MCVFPYLAGFITHAPCQNNGHDISLKGNSYIFALRGAVLKNLHFRSGQGFCPFLTAPLREATKKVILWVPTFSRIGE